MSITKTMALIRVAETAIQNAFDAKKIGGTVHLSIGQELFDASIITYYGGHDSPNGGPLVFGNHRSHGQYLAATNDLSGLFEQIKNGMSQHLYAEDKFLSHGIQGALLPVAFGAAMGLERKRPPKAHIRRTLCFIGDGTTGSGLLYETLNLLQAYPLPMSIIIINNRYAMSETIGYPDIYQLAKSFNMEYCPIGWDADPGEICESLSQYRPSCRNRPMLVECIGQRLCGHSCNDTEMYRPAVERTQEWRDGFDAVKLSCSPQDFRDVQKRVKGAADAIFTE